MYLCAYIWPMLTIMHSLNVHNQWLWNYTLRAQICECNQMSMTLHYIWAVYVHSKKTQYSIHAHAYIHTYIDNENLTRHVIMSNIVSHTYIMLNNIHNGCIVILQCCFLCFWIYEIIIYTCMLMLLQSVLCHTKFWVCKHLDYIVAILNYCCNQRWRMNQQNSLSFHNDYKNS